MPVNSSRNGATREVGKAGAFTRWAAKVPDATYNCPTVRWNGGTSWPVKSGHGCIACASHRFWDTMSPFYKPLPKVPGFGVDVTAEEIGWGVVGAVAALTAAHGVGSVIRAKKDSEDVQQEEKKPASPQS